jgi:hypothetical protein
MKTISTLVTLTLIMFSSVSFSQTYQNFEGGLGSIYGNCWTYSNDINLTSIVDKGGPISGTESMITLPPVNDGAKDYIYTPFLNLTAGSLRVSFKYALNTKLAGSAYRYIKLGLVDNRGVVLMLDSIYLDKTAPVNVVSYEKKFTLASTAAKRLYVEFTGNTGDGNSRLIFDDFYTSASYFYTATGCNRAPVAVNDAYLGVLGVTTSGNLTLNDSEPDGEVAVPSIVTTTVDGTLVVNTDGSFSFTPSKTFIGGKIVEFTYQLSDNGYSPLKSNVAKVTIDYSMALLACKLTNFDGKTANSNLSLKWAISNNETLARTEIQQSQDGKNFTTATAILASGKKGDENYYYTAKTALSGNMTYRLKMVDINNEVSYSKVVAVQSASAATGSYIKFVTGQSNQNVSVAFQSASGEVMNIRVTDLSGHVLHAGTQHTIKGSNVIEVPVSAAYAKGIYVVQMSNSSENFVAKFVKQ